MYVLFILIIHSSYYIFLAQTNWLAFDVCDIYNVLSRSHGHLVYIRIAKFTTKYWKFQDDKLLLSLVSTARWRT